MARKNRPARPPGSRPHPMQRNDPSHIPARRGSGRNPEPADADPDPDHHLWRNGRLWWVAFTVIHDGWRQERVRVSLQTDDVGIARRRRDELLRLVEEAGECKISLRFARRGAKQAGHTHPAQRRPQAKA